MHYLCWLHKHPLSAYTCAPLARPRVRLCCRSADCTSSVTALACYMSYRKCSSSNMTLPVCGSTCANVKKACYTIDDCENTDSECFGGAVATGLPLPLRERCTGPARGSVGVPVMLNAIMLPFRVILAVNSVSLLPCVPRFCAVYIPETGPSRLCTGGAVRSSVWSLLVASVVAAAAAVPLVCYGSRRRGVPPARL
jgi:hypothetical protein